MCEKTAGKQKKPKKHLSEEVLRFWDYKQNKTPPENYTVWCRDKVCWKCQNNHTWITEIRYMAKSPFCRLCKFEKNCLKNNSLIIKHWDYEENEFGPEHYTFGMKDIVYLKCPLNDNHRWSIEIRLITKDFSCQFCKFEKNCLTNYQEIMRCWDYEKNGDLKPDQFTIWSEDIVNWKCYNDESHTWVKRIYDQYRHSYCHLCKCKERGLITRPDIMALWAYDLNKNLNPELLLIGSSRRVSWRCHKGHVWDKQIINQCSNPICPVCYLEENCLSKKFPQIASELHPALNNNINGHNINSTSRIKLFWQCPVAPDHIYKMSVYERIIGRGCSICSGKIVVSSTSIETTHPHLISEWDYDKNHPLKPHMVSRGCCKKVSWICKRDPLHRWDTSIRNRTGSRERGCPICKLSKGEQFIKKILLKNNLKEKIDFETQGRLLGCISKKHLRFDFIIFYAFSPIAAIEYQGQHHYYVVEYFKNSLEDVKKRDLIKFNYCKENGIPLLSIPYWDFDNIEKNSL